MSEEKVNALISRSRSSSNEMSPQSKGSFRNKVTPPDKKFSNSMGQEMLSKMELMPKTKTSHISPSPSRSLIKS